MMLSCIRQARHQRAGTVLDLASWLPLPVLDQAQGHRPMQGCCRCSSGSRLALCPTTSAARTPRTTLSEVCPRSYCTCHCFSSCIFSAGSPSTRQAMPGCITCFDDSVQYHLGVALVKQAILLLFIAQKRDKGLAALAATEQRCVLAGLVFTVACEPYLIDEYGHPADAPVILQHDYLHGSRKQADHQVAASHASSGPDQHLLHGLDVPREASMHHLLSAACRPDDWVVPCVIACRARRLRLMAGTWSCTAQSSAGQLWQPPGCMAAASHGALRPSRRRALRLIPDAWAGSQVVILSKLLSGEETAGFSHCEDLRVHNFNGQPVRSLQHLARMVHACRAPYLRFDLDHNVGPLPHGLRCSWKPGLRHAL